MKFHIVAPKDESGSGSVTRHGLAALRGSEVVAGTDWGDDSWDGVYWRRDGG